MKPGDKKAAVSRSSLESDLVRRLCITLLAQCAIEGVIIILFLI